MTRAQIFMASKNWLTPLTNMNAAKTLLYKARKKGYVAAQPVTTKTVGFPSLLFRITKKADERCPEVRVIKEATTTSPVFNKVSYGLIPHTLGNSQLMALIHRSVGQLENIAVERVFRDHQFKAMVPIRKKGVKAIEGQIDPDNFVILQVPQGYLPIFIEGQRYSSRHLSTTPQGLIKAFQRRLTCYKVFLKKFHQHRLVHHLERELGAKLLQPKILIHSFERDNRYLDNLRAANYGDKHFQEVFLFAMLEKLTQVNVLTGKHWKRSDGKKVSVLNT
ncbi:MAG: hypothetical protein AAFQ83_22985 [Bacteroidota bacterium]